MIMWYDFILDMRMFCVKYNIIKNNAETIAEYNNDVSNAKILKLLMILSCDWGCFISNNKFKSNAETKTRYYNDVKNKEKDWYEEDLILDMRMVCVNQHKDNAETKHGYYNG